MQTDTSSKDKDVINDGWEYLMQYVLSFQLNFDLIIVFLQLYYFFFIFIIYNNIFIFLSF